MTYHAKKWTRELRTYPFSRLWTMTRETFNEQKSADLRDTRKVSAEKRLAIYADRLGISVEEAQARVEAQHQRLR